MANAENLMGVGFAAVAAVELAKQIDEAGSGGITQGAAVANATDEPSAVTQLNALLASLRASGAIAT